MEDYSLGVHIDQDILAKLGEISIYVFRSAECWDSEFGKDPQMLSIGKLHEKALKGKDLTHTMKYV